MATLAPSRIVPIALLYQAPSLHQHLKQALSDLGARVVYDTPAAQFDRQALDSSGAEVVVINLDPDVDEEFEQLGDLLADEALKVVFNDGEVSSRLEGWDQARWARHLAIKILGFGDTNPPRPVGSSAIPVKVRSAGPEYVGAREGDGSFELHGNDLERALSADTGEAISRTRDALVTKDEPVAAQLVPRPDPKDMPTLELPVGELMRDIPQWETAATPSAPAAAVSAVEPAAPPAPVHVAEEFQAVLRDFGFLEETKAPAASVASPAEDEFAALGAFDAAPPAPVAPAPAKRAAAPVDELDELSLSLDATAMAPVADMDVEELSLSALDFEVAPATNREVDELPFDDFDISTPAAAANATVDAGLGEFDLGGIELDHFDESGGSGTFGTIKESAAPQGLDDFLFELSIEEAEKADAEPKPARPERPLASPAVEPKKVEHTLRATATVEGKALSGARPELAPDAKADQAKTAPRAAPGTAPAAAAAPVAARKFDFSGLSLEPTDEERLAAPVTGRASYRIDELERKVAPPPTPSVAPPPPAAVPVAEDDEFSLDALEFSFDESAPITKASLLQGGSDESEEEPDLMAELEAVVGPTTPAAEAPSDGPVKRVWVLGASIGGPEAVREFLAALEPPVPVLFLLAQHMGSDFVELMTQQLSRATKLNVRNVSAGERVGYGDVVVVPLTERIQVDSEGTVKFSALDGMSPYSPSIDQVLMDVADRFGANAGAIIFSGMAHDAIDGSVYLKQKGGQVWAQDPATCVISSMVDGARDAGVVTFTGSPAELARQFRLQAFRAG